MNLYPFKFQPRLVPKMWGGRALARVVDKALPADVNVGESWELFDFPPGTVGPDATTPADDPAGWVSSKVANGPLKGESLHSVMLFERAALLGAAQPIATPHGPQFPLLVKFLDGRDDLSVQVHPPAAYADAHPGTALKNECWYVLDHADGARILIGAKPGTTREQFAAAIADGSVESLLNSVPVHVGDTFYLPSGTVHALGGRLRRRRGSDAQRHDVPRVRLQPRRSVDGPAARAARRAGTRVHRLRRRRDAVPRPAGRARRPPGSRR